MFIQQLFLVTLNMTILRDISYTLAVARFSPIISCFKLSLLYSHRCFLYVFRFPFRGHISKVGSEDICFSRITLHLMTLTTSSGLPLSLILWSDCISIVCCPQYFHKPQIVFFIYPSKDQSSHLWRWVIYSRCPLKPDLSCAEFLIYNLLFFLNWLTYDYIARIVILMLISMFVSQFFFFLQSWLMKV